MPYSFTRAGFGVLVGGCLWFLCQVSGAHDQLAVTRYQTVNLHNNVASMDVMAQTVQVHFGPTVHTVGEAMNKLLQTSGYALAPNLSLDVQHTLSKPLPLIDRTLGPMALNDALLALIGPAFNVEQDALNRTVNFRVKPSFQHEAKL